MVPGDKAALLDFFKRIPEEDRFYLKEDVTDAKVIERWTENLDYSRALPLLAEIKGKVIGDGTLHRNRAGARKHIAEIRIVVDPAYRNKGVGRSLLHKLVELAKDRGVEKVMFELVADTEEAARRTATIQGFMPVAHLTNHIRDTRGNTHNLVIMELEVPNVEIDDTEVF
jgi:GNAT superfamily N-acetyltransferase